MTKGNILEMINTSTKDSIIFQNECNVRISFLYIFIMEII